MGLAGHVYIGNVATDALFEPWGLYLTQHSTLILVRSAIYSNQVEDL